MSQAPHEGLRAEEAGCAQLWLRQESPPSLSVPEGAALGARPEHVRGARRVMILHRSGLCGDLNQQGHLCIVDGDTWREQGCCMAVVAETAAA